MRPRAKRIDGPADVAFFAKIKEDPTGCWLWTASLTAAGYGQFWDGPKRYVSHRWAYEFLIGEIPDGLVLDHLCRVRDCVNPWHVEPVPQRVNNQRGVGSGGRNFRKTACPRGHPYDRVRPNGWRRCSTCDKETGRRRSIKAKPTYASSVDLVELFKELVLIRDQDLDEDEI